MDEDQLSFEQEILAAKTHLTDLKVSKGKLIGCTSYIQRKMQIGYNHAARLLDELERRHFITAPDNNGERHGVAI